MLLKNILTALYLPNMFSLVSNAIKRFLKVKENKRIKIHKIKIERIQNTKGDQRSTQKRETSDPQYTREIVKEIQEHSKRGSFKPIVQP